MKKYLLIFLIVMTYTTCKNKSVDTPVNTNESISFNIDVQDYTIILGSSFSINLSLISTMPTSGIKIEVTTIDQVTNSIIFSQVLLSNQKRNLITILNLIQQHTNKVNVKISSVNDPNNSSVKSLIVIYK